MAVLNNIPAGKRLLSLYVPAFIAALYLVLALTSVQHDDVTFDESPHLRYGIQLIKGNTDRTPPGEKRFRSTMPVTALNAIPRGIEQVLHPATKKTDWGDADIKSGRYITILLTLILLLYCFRFASALFSESVGCIVLLLVATDPNILAHSRLVTTDVYAATAFVATVYHLWKWLVKKEARHFYYWCIAIAVAQCCKANNILLYPACLLPILVYSFQKGPRTAFLPGLAKTLAFAALQVLVINAFFLFQGFGVSLGQMPLQSHFFRSLQLHWIAKIPLPLPRAYTSTFDLVQYERESFDGTALNYLLGELRYKKGFLNYYLVCYMLKTPLVSIAVTFAGIVYSCTVKKLRRESILFGWWPCVLVVVFLSTSSIQNGYRYLLPATCLALIFCGGLVQEALRRLPVLSVPGFCLFPLLTALLSFPNYLAYTNPLVTDKKSAYRYFADSNLNWGQRRSTLAAFLHEHPGYIFEPAIPQTGMIVVDINNLTGILNTEKYRWLRTYYVPVATIDNCYLIYDVKQLPGTP